MNPTRIMRDERGSLPMALLAVIVVAGIVTVLLGTVVTGQRQTRFDQSFEQALQTGEDGLDRVVALLERELLVDGDGNELTIGTSVQLDSAALGAMDGEWVAQVDRLGTKAWLIRSTGTSADGTQRTVEMRIDVDSLFDTAAFGKFFAEFAGHNYVDSYRSGHFDSEGKVFTHDGDSRICLSNGNRAVPGSTGGGANVEMCARTGNGVVATNGSLFLRGQDYDNIHGHVEIHYARERVTDPIPDATGYCQGVAVVCNDWNPAAPNAGKLRYYREELVLPVDPVILEETPSGPFDPDSTWECEGSADDPGNEAWDSCLGPGIHYFTNVTLTSRTKIEGTADEGNRTIIYASGMVRVPRQEYVNFHPGADGTLEPRPAPSLLIFSSGTGPAIDMRNHSSISAGVFAPNGAATGGAGVNIYGSIVAGSITTQGGWRFHYDEALGEVLVEAPIVASSWTEVFDHVTPDGG